jgi:hypothetical protein
MNKSDFMSRLTLSLKHVAFEKNIAIAFFQDSKSPKKMWIKFIGDSISPAYLLNILPHENGKYFILYLNEILVGNCGKKYFESPEDMAESIYCVIND